MSLPLLVAVAFACCRAANAFASKGALQVDGGPRHTGPNLMQAGAGTVAAELDWCLQQLKGHPRLNHPSLIASCQQSLPSDTCQAASAVLGEPPFSAETVLAACSELSRAALNKRAHRNLTLLSRGKVARVSSGVELDSALQRKKEKQPFLEGPPYPKLVCPNMTMKTNKATGVANVSMPTGSNDEGCWIWEDAHTTTTSTSTSTTTMRNGTATGKQSEKSKEASKKKASKKSKEGMLVQIHSSEGTDVTSDASISAAAVPAVATTDMSYFSSYGIPRMRLSQWPW